MGLFQNLYEFTARETPPSLTVAGIGAKKATQGDDFENPQKRAI